MLQIVTAVEAILIKSYRNFTELCNIGRDYMLFVESVILDVFVVFDSD